MSQICIPTNQACSTPIAPTARSSTPTTHETLLALGYVQAVPPWLHSANEKIDRKACSRLRCVCGRNGMVYKPFFRLIPQSYRVRACCEACGHVEIV